MTDHGPDTASTDAFPGTDPGDLDELLRGAASRAGGGERTRRALEDMREDPPTPLEGQYASVELVKLLGESRDEGDAAEAERIAAELLRPGRLDEGPAQLLGEHFQALERWDEALHCYNIAARRLVAAPPARLAEEEDLSLAPLVSRLLARMRLGMAHDEHDEVALGVARRQVEALADLSRTGQDRPETDVAAFCSRESFEGARAGGVLSGGAAEEGADAYCRAAERALRERARLNPRASRAVVLYDLDEVTAFAERSGLDPADEATATAWARRELAPDDPRIRAWPPARNEACWCASGRKYKKCCGSPANR
ncbi:MULTISPECIES: SEC-C domain-containing protein [unclassified Nocardiopsis]|uniref:SEC-C domain-containing protein n=1 Tax=unclassified Nocardiopsis TaxID=2649073 RepID=UPI00135A8B7C|nr:MULTISPECIES: SEC-C domain-containing protein [unclassified Nocardiopsis]